MTIASLIVDVAATTAKLQTDVNQINKSLDSVADIAGRVGSALGIAFSVGTVVNFVREMTAFASRMSDVSAQTGIGVEALQALNFAAVGSGVSIDQLATAISQLSKRLIEGSPSTVQAVRDLGLSLTQLRSQSPDQAFLAIAEAIKGIPDPMKQSQVAMELFGRSGAQLLPLMKEDLKALTSEAHRTGAVIDEDLIRRADEFDDAWERGKLQIKALTLSLFESKIEWENNAKAIAEVHQGLMRLPPSLKPLINDGFKPLAMSMDEADRIGKQLTETAKEQIKVNRDHQKSVEDATKAHREFTNWIGVREIEAIEELGKAQAKFIRDEIRMLEERIRAQREFQEESQRILDADEAAWRNHRNEIGLIMMENDRLQMEHNERMRFTWGDTFNSIGSFLNQFSETFDGIVSDKWMRTMEHFREAFGEARNVVGGILRGMSGDFSGWVDAVMAGIRMVRAAWNALKELFGGGEEGVHVNPARDAFLGRFKGMPGDIDDPNNPPGFHALARLLSDLSGEPGGGPLFAALTAAETMDAFNRAVEAILSFLREHNVPGFAGGTHGLRDFGPQGTLVRLHNREEVRTEAQVNAERGGWGAVVAAVNRLSERLDANEERVSIIARDAALKAMA